MKEILTDFYSGVFAVTLNRPDKMNSLTMPMCRELETLFLRCDEDDDIRTLLLMANGPGFSAGRDLSNVQESDDARELLGEYINPAITALYQCRKPTVSSVNGPAMGIGLGLALACDVVLGSERACFSSPFAKMGASLDSGGNYFLSRRLGPGRALSMIYTSELVMGKKANDIGLIDKLIAPEVLQKASMRFAKGIAAGPTVSLQRQKRLFRRSFSMDLVEVLGEEAKLMHELSSNTEFAEGLASYRERRPANFLSIQSKEV